MAECPTCDETFDTERGMKVHHVQQHNESLCSVTLRCSACDTEFERGEYNLVEAENYYCSYECRRRDGKHDCPKDGCDYTSDSELGIKQHHKRTHGISLTKVEVTCDWCENVFQRQQSVNEAHECTFCSQECKYQALANQMSEERRGEGNPMYGKTGEDHPNWNGGYEPHNYGKGWLQSRRNTLERDDYECQDCGMARNEHYDEYSRDLEVHHITPFRTFDNSATANELENLVTVCKSCHRARESR